MKRHYMFDVPPRGFGAVFLGGEFECIWLPLPFCWVRRGWLIFLIWKAERFDAPLYRYNHRNDWRKETSMEVVWNMMNSTQRYEMLTQIYPDCWTVNRLSLQTWNQLLPNVRVILRDAYSCLNEANRTGETRA